MLRRGEYVIMNDFDRPEAMLVAVLERYDDKAGIWHALYLARATNMEAPYGPLPTPLSAFAQRVEWNGDKFLTVPTGASVTATYRDGRPRSWQDYRQGREWVARVKARNFCAKFSTKAAAAA